MAFPQYSKTVDSAVIEAIRANEAGVADFHRRACDFAIAQGVEQGSYYPSSFAGHHSIRAIGGDTKPTTGRWKQGYGGYGWLPFKSNPLAAELDALEFREGIVPNLPTLVDGPPDSSGRHVISTPHPFVVEGVAYVGCSFIPVDGMEPVEVGDWEEIRASEYHAAMEKYNDDITNKESI